MADLKIGAHVDQTDPVAEAQARGADLVQFFLGDPQGYKGPEIRYAAGADALREAAEAAGIDLVHANDSRDAFDSGADRHANFGAGKIAPEDLAGVVRAARAPVVCETPGGPAEHQADFDWLRDRL